jgi:hypothetical protein
MTALNEAGRPAVIHDPGMGGARFVAEAAVIDLAGWLHARGRRRVRQVPGIEDLGGPVIEKSWSPACRVRIEWKAAAA